MSMLGNSFPLSTGQDPERALGRFNTTEEQVVTPGTLRESASP